MHRLRLRIDRAVLTASVAAVLALTASVAASSEARADQIAYSCGSDICLINPDNPAEQTNLTQTTAGIGDERSPSWSPDGKLIAYIGSYGALTEGWDVFTLDPAKSAAEGEFTNLSETKDRGADFEHPPVWSRDGSRIAYPERYYSNEAPNLGEDLYVSPFDGSAPPLAISSNSQTQNSPSWLPDGKTLAFSQGGVTTFAAADGSGSTTVLANGSGIRPTMSPDGKYIAVEALGSYPYEMRIVNADGSGFHDLARPVDLGSSFSWSSDSTRIAYISDEVSSEDQVRVAPADGSSPGVVVPMPSGWIVAHDPVISPDGTRVAFHARNESLGGWEQILVGPADGSAPATAITKAATNNDNPAWKPCEGCAPPVVNKPTTTGAGPGGEAKAPTNTPQKLRFALFKAPVYDGKYMRIAWVDCNAVGGNPTREVAEVCSFYGDGITRGYAPTLPPRPRAGIAGTRAKPKPKPILFAKGSVKVPVGKSKPLKLKLTAAGKKLLKPGKTVKIEVTITKTQPGQKKQKVTKTVKLKIPAKKG